MKKFRLIVLCILSLSLVACGGKDYTRDTSEGKVKEVNYAELTKMMKSNEKFMTVVTQTKCEHCIKYKEEVITPYLKKHNITLLEFNITNEASGQAAFENFKKDIDKLTKDENKKFMGTPYTYIMEGKDFKEGESGILEAKDFDKWVVKYELDKKAL